MHRRRSEGSAGPIVQPLTEGRVPVGSQVLARAAARRAPLAGAQPFLAEDVLDLATAVLRPDPPQETRHSFLATDGTEAVGVITGIITRLTPQDEAHTYLPPRHLLLPLSGWAVGDDVPRTLPALAGAAQALAREEGLDRCTVQVLPGDTEALSVWSALGWRADTHLARRGGRPPARRPDGPRHDPAPLARHSGAPRPVRLHRPHERDRAGAWTRNRSDTGERRSALAAGAEGAVAGPHRAALRARQQAVEPVLDRLGFVPALTHLTDAPSAGAGTRLREGRRVP